MLKTAFVKGNSPGCNSPGLSPGLVNSPGLQFAGGWGFPECFTSDGAFAALRITACALTTTKSITLSGVCLRQHE
jgi:hypothetical protein